MILTVLAAFLTHGTAHAATYQDTCMYKMATAARFAHTEHTGRSPSEVLVHGFTAGLSTVMAAENTFNASVDVGVVDGKEVSRYALMGHQAGSSTDCTVDPARYVDSRVIEIDRSAFALSLTPQVFPESKVMASADPRYDYHYNLVLGALEAIDQTYPLTKRFASVSIKPAAEPSKKYGAVILEYTLGWGDCLSGCSDEGRVVVEADRNAVSQKYDVYILKIEGDVLSARP